MCIKSLVLSCLTFVSLILIATFWPHTEGLHQPIYWTSLMFGGFWSKALLALWEEENDPSAVRCGWDRLSCFLIVGIHTSGISIPLSLLMLLGWSLMWIASWKRYVDDTFTILKRNNVEDLLQHRNTQQPTIRFTMESENDNTIPFLDT